MANRSRSMVWERRKVVLPDKDYESAARAKTAKVLGMLAKNASTAAKPPSIRTINLLLSMIDFAGANIEMIVFDIHDLWSGRLFDKGFRYAAQTSINMKTHVLLKPLEEFSQDEIQLEKTLALADLEAIQSVMQDRFSVFPETRVPVSAAALKRIYHCGAIPGAICHLVDDRGFVVHVARLAHDAWRKAKNNCSKTTDDDRLQHAYDQLSLEAKLVTLENFKVDILALLLFFDRLGRSWSINR